MHTSSGGTYALGEILGSGGMGTVFRATEAASNRTVAVKILNEDLAGDRRAVRRFRRESAAAARVAHPNLVPVLDRGETADGRPLFVMEHVAGHALGALARVRPMSIGRVCRIAGQLLAALAAVHRAGMVHADVKSDNVLVELVRGGTERVRLIDLGLVHVPAAAPDDELVSDDDDRVDDDGEPCAAGTPEYMAPEILRGGDPTPASDLYAVGVILYELLTGTTPFAGSIVDVVAGHLQDDVVPPSVRRPGRRIPAAFDRVVMRALAKAPADRFADADELAAAVLAIAPPAASYGEILPAIAEPLAA